MASLPATPPLRAHLATRPVQVDVTEGLDAVELRWRSRGPDWRERLQLGAIATFAGCFLLAAIVGTCWELGGQVLLGGLPLSLAVFLVASIAPAPRGSSDEVWLSLGPGQLATGAQRVSATAIREVRLRGDTLRLGTDAGAVELRIALPRTARRWVVTAVETWWAAHRQPGTTVPAELAALRGPRSTAT